MRGMADHIAHLIDDDGVTEAPFTQAGPTTYTNSEEITLRPGSVLDLGGGLAIRYPSSPPEIVWLGLELDAW